MIDKKKLISHLVAFVVGICLCLMVSHCIRKPVEPAKIKVERDTIIVTDTIPQYFPQPVDGMKVKTEYRWLTKVLTDTVVKTDVITCHDSVLVEVPIESKHYHANEYDAWVSGFEPNLDSIFVYQKTEYITTTITKMKPPNKWSLSVNAGVDYGTTSQFWQPYASGELTINNDKRLQLGIEGGVKKSEVTNNFEPFAGAKLKLKIF